MQRNLSESLGIFKIHNLCFIFVLIVIYGPWMNHVEGYWKERHRTNILFVTYEEMQQVCANIHESDETTLYIYI